MKMSDEFFRRLKAYSRPASKSWWHGEHTPENIERWQARATENSDSYKHRAKDGPMELPDTGKKIELRDTSMKPFRKRSVDAILKDAKSDPNHDGSSFMKEVRRKA
jgi:hypothetical protein